MVQSDIQRPGISPAQYLKQRGHVLRRNKHFFCIFILFVSVSTITTLIYSRNHPTPKVVTLEDSPPKYEERATIEYVQDQGSIDQLSNTVTQTTLLPLLINTSVCKIPELDPWDLEVKRFYMPPYYEPRCDEKLPKWSSIDHARSELVFDEDLMDAEGHPFQDLNCCYMTVTRTSDPELRPDRDLDYSPCTSVRSPRTEISSEFIVVECSSLGFILGTKIVYRNFHALVPPSTVVPRLELRKPRPLLDKMKELPPNIIILGLDSTSRLNFRRFMNKTRKVLESLGAKEMLGYTKVGENTYDNMVSHLMGYHRENQVPDLCFVNNKSFHDGCPFIWSHLEKAGYLTAHAEDSETFSYEKDGFINAPVDFYLYPLFIAAFNYIQILGQRYERGYYAKPCTGYQINNEVLLDYVEATLDFARNQKRPIFNYAWPVHLTHDHVSGLPNVDDLYAAFLKQIQSKGHLENSILLVIGDHGYRHGPVRETMVGAFENKLPVLWIYLPERIRKDKPEWVEALSFNADQLTSSYAIYWSIHLILKTFALEGSYEPPEDAKSVNTGEIVKRHPNHQNFFEPAQPNSSCADLGITSQFCACDQPQTLLTPDDKLVRQAAELAVEHINEVKIDKNKCAQLSLATVEGAAVSKNEDQDSRERYIISFTTKPGDALFEAGIYYWAANKTFDTSEEPSIARINKMTMDDVTCIHDHLMELLCYCKR